MALLLIEKGSNVNHASNDGTTPLHIAAGMLQNKKKTKNNNQIYLLYYTDAGNIPIVKSLVTHGAVQKMDSAGYTPIMSASKVDANVTKVLRLLYSFPLFSAPPLFLFLIYTIKVLEELLKNVKIDHTVSAAKKQETSAPTKPKVCTGFPSPSLALSLFLLFVSSFFEFSIQYSTTLIYSTYLPRVVICRHT